MTTPKLRYLLSFKDVKSVLHSQTSMILSYNIFIKNQLTLLEAVNYTLEEVYKKVSVVPNPPISPRRFV